MDFALSEEQGELAGLVRKILAERDAPWADLAAAGVLAAALPPAQQGIVPRIVAGVHDAFASSVAELFWLSLAASALALVAIVLVREVPLRGGQRGEAGEAGDLAVA